MNRSSYLGSQLQEQAQIYIKSILKKFIFILRALLNKFITIFIRTVLKTFYQEFWTFQLNKIDTIFSHFCCYNSIAFSIPAVRAIQRAIRLFCLIYVHNEVNRKFHFHLFYSQRSCHETRAIPFDGMAKKSRSSDFKDEKSEQEVIFVYYSLPCYCPAVDIRGFLTFRSGHLQFLSILTAFKTPNFQQAETSDGRAMYVLAAHLGKSLLDFTVYLHPGLLKHRAVG